MSEKIKTKIIEMVARQLCINDQELTVDMHIFDDLGADSLDAIELAIEAEEEFDIQISDYDAEAVKTVQDAIDLVSRLAVKRNKT